MTREYASNDQKCAEAPIVGVIIVTWNKKEDVLHLLKQLEEQEYPPDSLEIAVVDNHSTDGTAEAVRSLFPGIHVIENPENLGGAGGFNTGMKWFLTNRPGTEYLWLLDNDILVERNALKALVDVLRLHPEAGICGSRIMNREKPDELIELGAFIDYRGGGIRSNIPKGSALKDPKGVFVVDYVAACSLLARADMVREQGLWNDHLFIYWDDMEWGARFTSNGYKVLASNASCVYHPSWAKRNADNSAIWRTYYRVRNSLWFFNTYTRGLKRRMLLSRMVFKFSASAINACIQSQVALSQAVMQGIKDFFQNRYGKKEFVMPSSDIETYLQNHFPVRICVFVPDKDESPGARQVMEAILARHPVKRLIGVIPETEKEEWSGILSGKETVTFVRGERGVINKYQQLKIMRFLSNTSWDLLISSANVPKFAGMWGRDILRVDYTTGETISIERMNFRILFSLPLLFCLRLCQGFLRPPLRHRPGAPESKEWYRDSLSAFSKN